MDAQVEYKRAEDITGLALRQRKIDFYLLRTFLFHFILLILEYRKFLASCPICLLFNERIKKTDDLDLTYYGK